MKSATVRAQAQASAMHAPGACRDAVTDRACNATVRPNAKMKTHMWCMAVALSHSQNQNPNTRTWSLSCFCWSLFTCFLLLRHQSCSWVAVVLLTRLLVKPCASSCPFSYATLARTPSYLPCPSMHSIPGWLHLFDPILLLSFILVS